MHKQKIAQAKKTLTDSAFDFLKRSAGEIDDHPKYSVIHFAIAVELLLKARLMHEHWSLVVEKVSDADINDFLSGKCKTVSTGEAIKRLEKVCQQSIPMPSAKQFEKIAAHRNKMVHFFHEATSTQNSKGLVEGIVKEQCLGWFYLENLLLQWSDQFSEFAVKITETRCLCDEIALIYPSRSIVSQVKLQQIEKKGLPLSSALDADTKPQKLRNCQSSSSNKIVVSADY
ncbi:hypothetical protein OGR47_00695 [Methylocystis sp. MJC1]|jgi:hypothetical protein|uniref:hypothetical protein n=1 Tax=Methylocystis sp. MJC1 TaxID=2654282 RepID=UPI0013ED4C95|nr:hypothetical protein [Methylocystis sp. MJC1]MBU6525536.1 hypothetical protein [Methylocystis sp. MJC1]UZX12020.1 hypothetical protein OGR47_00695 [Methylocystis sp. MJC1]